LIPLLAFGAVVAMMGIELRVSRRHERLLRASGAREAPGDVYPWMRIVYPACFVAMTIEGLIVTAPQSQGAAPGNFGHLRGILSVWLGPMHGAAITIAGVVVLAASKALKTWAIVSLGPAWSFRVLVRPGTPLVRSGPYRCLRHPNYASIVGELLGMALLARAPVTGIASLLAFGILLRRRIHIEEQAVGLQTRAG
jgi:methyltransferase